MTKEIEVVYGQLCGSCRKKVLEHNMDQLRRLRKRYSYFEISKLTGIPTSTLKDALKSIKRDANG